MVQVANKHAQMLFTLVIIILILPSLVIADNTFKLLKNKRSYLTYKGIGYVGQQLPGYWWLKSKRGDQIYHFSFLNGNKILVIHTGDSPKIIPWYKQGERFLKNKYFNGIVGQFKFAGDRCFKGISSTIEMRKPNRPPKCPQYQWWAQSGVCFNKKHLNSSETIFAEHHDTQSCRFNKSPNKLDFKYERFLGASFAPFMGNKYIHRFQTLGHYELAVKIAWDYRELKSASRAPSKVRVRLVSKQVLVHSGGLSGNYTFRTPNPGKYTFEVEVRNASDSVIHRDYLTAIIPGI